MGGLRNYILKQTSLQFGQFTILNTYKIAWTHYIRILYTFKTRKYKKNPKGMSIYTQKKDKNLEDHANVTLIILKMK